MSESFSTLSDPFFSILDVRSLVKREDVIGVVQQIIDPKLQRLLKSRFPSSNANSESTDAFAKAKQRLKQRLTSKGRSETQAKQDLQQTIANIREVAKYGNVLGKKLPRLSASLVAAQSLVRDVSADKAIQNLFIDHLNVLEESLHDCKKSYSNDTWDFLANQTDRTVHKILVDSACATVIERIKYLDKAVQTSFRELLEIKMPSYDPVQISLFNKCQASCKSCETALTQLLTYDTHNTDQGAVLASAESVEAIQKQVKALKRDIKYLWSGVFD